MLLCFYHIKQDKTTNTAS